jgi:ferric-dicitrate binding protein FerR (iron transport regulator)
MTKERFEFLFEQYKADRLSQEDWDELRMAIRDGFHSVWLQDDFWQTMERGGLHETWTPELEESVWRQIMKQRHPAAMVMSGEEEETPVVSMKRSSFNRNWVIWCGSVAASLLIITVLLCFFRPVSKHGVPVIATHVAGTEVHPGGDKAILTLADGTRIALDSVKNGQIARQGAATFNKSNGTLSISFAGAGGMAHNQPGSTSADNIRAESGVGAEEAFVSTPRGGQYQLILPDGSKVWLNSASTLRFPTVFKGKERSVQLSGEGYFEIAKNAAMPFSVTVNQMKVRVLGTHFNTMAYSDEKTINTTLLEGAVEVSEGDLTKRLLPGQQAALNSAGHQLAVGQADIQKAIAWKNGLFEFDHTDLAMIMRQLARWYDIEIIYRVSPDKTPLGGSISRNLGLTEVLNLLEANGINHFKTEGKKVFVLP